jgi:hypothetical protein
VGVDGGEGRGATAPPPTEVSPSPVGNILKILPCPSDTTYMYPSYGLTSISEIPPNPVAKTTSFENDSSSVFAILSFKGSASTLLCQYREK